MIWYRKYYRCSECGHEWEDVWDCLCNDRCPLCGVETEPYDHEEIEDEDDDPQQVTVVVFRKWKNGDIIALFPELASDYAGYYCDSYEHVGQHGGADYFGVIQHTKPCSLDEAADLARELRNIGYILRPLRRATYKHHEARRRMAASFQKATSFPNK